MDEVFGKDEILEEIFSENPKSREKMSGWVERNGFEGKN